MTRRARTSIKIGQQFDRKSNKRTGPVCFFISPTEVKNKYKKLKLFVDTLPHLN